MAIIKSQQSKVSEFNRLLEIAEANNLNLASMHNHLGDSSEAVIAMQKSSENIASIKSQLSNIDKLDTQTIINLSKHLEYHNSEIMRQIAKLNPNFNTMSDILKKIVEDSNSKPKFIGENFFNDFNNYLTTLPIEKAAYLANILCSIGMFLSLISLIGVFYGD
jgi:hypothetical protein